MHHFMILIEDLMPNLIFLFFPSLIIVRLTIVFIKAKTFDSE